MSTDRYLPLAGRLHRVTHSEPTSYVMPTLADLECDHGKIGACLECDLAPTDASRSVLARGHCETGYLDAPATLADFECEHYVIGPCQACVPALPAGADQLVLEVS